MALLQLVCVTFVLMLVSLKVESFQLRSSRQMGAIRGTRVPVSMLMVNYRPDDKIDLLYDSHCPLCTIQVEFLRKRDINGRVKFTDLQAHDYNPADHGHVEFERGMRKIRAVMPDQSVVSGVEVFRQTYDAIGLGWMFAMTNLPVIGFAADMVYDIWAENRLRITGRGELADVLKEQAEYLLANPVSECNSDACSLDWD
ncbi:hypothetical protein B484DRAFT_459181 [Ochromonadaceae sp. CCMP2298]|nr:hypothetical protein B484DRAFT_459181 [Ochromonadaceae sp. CCMP2298]|mmetsp:Transcript_31148/g.68688  ORF Transcript_31148/g.68688 Transcript_31148/m.68688 type:complete len:199 (+) Transcript_31148:80-676(+)|eukprot:CAMPEP_0173252944 /NCGR_PEP_ID=MMETSP1142-20121109/21038_1 /TAXON_ID=483371 /ORGANISM="non described non described, Strain CCMP2298" /LENGTH=198 /DNA_ID=CAMNT_0014186103 /DNA_START=1 /DNA_END=597 /DNA_ORIENTATION=+